MSCTWRPRLRGLAAAIGPVDAGFAAGAVVLEVVPAAGKAQVEVATGVALFEAGTAAGVTVVDAGLALTALVGADTLARGQLVAGGAAGEIVVAGWALAASPSSSAGGGRCSERDGRDNG